MAESNGSRGSDVHLEKDPGRMQTDGAKFEYLLAGLLSLRARREGLRFQIFTNVQMVDKTGKGAESINAFDDIVLRVWFNKGNNERILTYYFQLKQSRKEKDITYARLTQENGKFSLKRFFAFFKNLPQLLQKNSKLKELRKCKEDDNIFIIYTTHKVEHQNNGTASTFPFGMNTGKKKNVFQFSQKDEDVWALCPEDESQRYRKSFLPKLWIFEQQKAHSGLSKLIQEEMTLFVGSSLVTETCLIKYERELETWWNNDKGSCLTETTNELEELVKSYVDDRRPKNEYIFFKQSECEKLAKEIEKCQITYVEVPEISGTMQCAKILQIIEHVNKERYMVLNQNTISGITHDALVRTCSRLCDAVVFNIDQWPADMQKLLLRVFTETDCKLVVVSSSQEFLLERHFSKSCYREISDEWSLDHLTEQSQAWFLDKSITFQGQSVKLSHLRTIWPLLPQAVDGPMLCALAAGRPVSVGEAPPGPDPGQPYIQRTLEHRTALRPELLRLRAPSEHFVLSGFPPDKVREWLGNDKTEKRADDQDKEMNKTSDQPLASGEEIFRTASFQYSHISYYTRNYYQVNDLFDIELDSLKSITLLPYDSQLKEDEETFNYVSKQYRINVHWLQYKSGHIFWRKTEGNSAIIIKHVEEIGKDCQKNELSAFCQHSEIESEFSLWGKKAFLVTGEPGMGKTMLLQNIKQKINENKSFMWVLHIKLTIKLKELKIIPTSKAKIDEVLEFLIATQEFGNYKSFSRKIIEDCINRIGGIAVCIDDIDELSSENRERAFCLVKSLLETRVTHVWVASTKCELQEIPRFVTLKIRNLSKQQQTDYLVEKWFSESEKESEEKRKQIEKFAENLVTTIHGRSDPFCDVLNFPLHLNMLAQIFKDKALGCADAGEVDMLQLYDDFVEMKYELARKKISKENTNDPIILQGEKSLRDIHKAFARDIVIKGEVQSETLLNIQKKILKCDRSGFIMETNTGMWKFFHESFAEYFAALHFFENKESITEDIYTSGKKLLKQFFDRKLSDGYSLHEAVLANDEQSVSAEIEHVEATDEGGRQPLHLAALDGHKKIAQLLLDAGADVGARDGLLGWTPLRYACATEQWEAAELLLQNGGAEDDVGVDLTAGREDEIFNNIVGNGFVKLTVTLFAKFFKHPSLQNLFLLARCGNPEILRALKSKFDQAKDQTVNITIQENHLTPLHLAAHSGRIKYCKELLNDGADVNARDMFGTTPLHLTADAGHTGTGRALIKRGAKTFKDHRGDTPMHIAAANGHKGFCRMLLEEGADIKSRDKNGYEPLHQAAMRGQIKSAELLIGKGAEVEASANDGATPLHLAAIAGHTDMCCMLLKKGADVSCRDNKGNEPLHAAAQEGKTETAELLIRKGAKIKPNAGGVTPLHLAAFNGHSGFCSMLLRRGADISCRDQKGNEPLHLAAQQGKTETAELLIKKGAKIKPNADGATPLHLAAANGHTELCCMLLRQGADISCPDNKGNEPLHGAAQQGKTETAELLIRKGAKIKSNAGGVTPLHLAAFHGHAEFCSMLLRQGADISCPDNKGNEPLHGAAQQGKTETAELLIKKGAKIKSNADGATPLHLAAANGHTELCCMLLRRGADIWCRDQKGNEPLHLAAQQGKTETAELLIKKGAKIKPNADGATPLHLAAANGHTEFCTMLLGQGADVSCTNNKGNEPLHWAAQQGKTETAELLIEKGAKIKPNADGATPLHFAAFHGHTKLCCMLLRQGADISCTDNKGNEPLHWAAQQGKTETAELLIKKGAKIKPNAVGLTPLHLAAANGHTEFCRFLLGKGADVAARDIRGSEPLHWAAAKGNTDTAVLLIDKGADINSTNASGETVMRVASDNGHGEFCSMIRRRAKNCSFQNS